MSELAAATSRSFAFLSRLRGKRVFHPHGVGFAGTLRPVGSAVGAEIFDGGERQVVARLSRSAGLPERLHDPCGIGLRVPDAYGRGRHQDLLLVTSSSARVGRHMLLPAGDFTSAHYSTLLPYRLGGGLVLIGAIAVGPSGRTRLADLAGRRTAGLRFAVLIAGLLGRWREVATLELRNRMPDDEIEGLRLDPGNTGGGLELAGLLNRLRGPAYEGSQRGRTETGDLEAAGLSE